VSSNRERIDPKEFAKPDSPNIEPKEYFEAVRMESNISMREDTMQLLSWCFILSVLLTFTIFFLQGFSFHGFDLPIQLLHWLGGAVIGETSGLLVIGFRYIFSSE